MFIYLCLRASVQNQANINRAFKFEQHSYVLGGFVNDLSKTMIMLTLPVAGFLQNVLKSAVHLFVDNVVVR